MRPSVLDNSCATLYEDDNNVAGFTINKMIKKSFRKAQGERESEMEEENTHVGHLSPVPPDAVTSMHRTLIYHAVLSTLHTLIFISHSNSSHLKSKGA